MRPVLSSMLFLRWPRPDALASLVTGVLLLLSALGTLFASGCGTTRSSHTARTATEQLVLTSAWDQALARIDFRPLAGASVFLDIQHVNGVDKGWMISSIREALIRQGVLLQDAKEQARWVVEARVGVYGTDSYDWMIGVPEVPIPPGFAGIQPPPLPELPVAKKQDQHAWTKVALFAYERTTGQYVWESGTILASANSKDVYIFGLGPIRSGTIREGAELMGVQIPLTGDSSEPSPEPARELPYLAPPRVLPPAGSDIESLAPITDPPKIDPNSYPARETGL